MLWLIAGIPASALALLTLLGASGGRLLPAVVAILLPAIAIAAALRTRLTAPGAVGVALLIWGATVWVGAPAWIDRTSALRAAGLSAELAVMLDARLPGLSASPPAEVLLAESYDCDCDDVIAATAVAPMPAMGEEDLVVLPYEGTATSMRLPITLEWGGREVDTELIFDTGATLTSIKPELLAALGYTVPDDAPVISTQTANGRRETPLLLLDRVWLGGFPIDNVSVIVCDNCGDLNGLLGLNISGSFRVEVDQSSRELLFRPEARPSRQLDVRSWLSLGLQERGERLTAVVRSRAPVPITELEVEVSCGSEADVLSLGPLEAGGTARGPVAASVWCDQPQMSVIYASW
jgi:hypothetical protein